MNWMQFKPYRNQTMKGNLQQKEPLIHENVVDGSSMIGFPLYLIADSEWDMPAIEPGLLGWHTSALTTELKEVMQ